MSEDNPIPDEIKEVLRDLYRISAMQMELDQKGLTLEIKWGSLTARLDRVLTENGIDVPTIAEFDAVRATEL